jgi:hypothetical protein
MTLLARPRVTTISSRRGPALAAAVVGLGRPSRTRRVVVAPVCRFDLRALETPYSFAFGCDVEGALPNLHLEDLDEVIKLTDH